MRCLRCGEANIAKALPYMKPIDRPGWSDLATRESRAALRHLMLRPGQAVEGRNILVLAEQGFGDGIVFARHRRAGGTRSPGGRRLQCGEPAFF